MGTGREGLWVSPTGLAGGLAFIDPSDAYLGFRPGDGGLAPLLFEGAWSLAGSNWLFSPSSTATNASGGVPVAMSLCGSGTVTPRAQFQGAYTLASCTGSSTSFTMDYASANALAVAPGDLAATWSSSQLTVTVGAGGATTGSAGGASFGTCVLSGSIAPRDAGSAKNVYVVSLALSDVTPGSCTLDTTHGAYQGFGAITFTEVGTSGAPRYIRAFTLLVRASSGIWFAAELVKQ